VVSSHAELRKPAAAVSFGASLRRLLTVSLRLRAGIHGGRAAAPPLRWFWRCISLQLRPKWFVPGGVAAGRRRSFDLEEDVGRDLIAFSSFPEGRSAYSKDPCVICHFLRVLLYSSFNAATFRVLAPGPIQKNKQLSLALLGYPKPRPMSKRPLADLPCRYRGRSRPSAPPLLRQSGPSFIAPCTTSREAQRQKWRRKTSLPPTTHLLRPGDARRRHLGGREATRRGSGLMARVSHPSYPVRDEVGAHEDLLNNILPVSKYMMFSLPLKHMYLDVFLCEGSLVLLLTYILKDNEIHRC
jgi:hypothetical protein